jgi:ATP-binding cassette, subfamily B, multidrug efflux pump
MKRNKKSGVLSAIISAAGTHRILSIATVLCAAASVAASLVPPLLLADIVDSLTAGNSLMFSAVITYFLSLALEGVLSSAQAALLETFGQRMTHSLRSEMSKKLTSLPAATLSAQDPGEVAARFLGDVDTVEALFTSGVISMAADACRIVSIFAVIAAKNTGLALILIIVLPLLAAFTRHVQKRMLSSQLENRRAVAKISAQVPEAMHNIRTIHALGLEEYMERRYDDRLGDSYNAMEKNNFYDALYSPAVLMLNAAVVGTVMLLSASGNANVLSLFGMSVGTSVAVINYISRIFSPIESLGMEIQTIQSAMAGVKRIDSFLAEKEREIPAGANNGAVRGDIEFSHVSFGYDERLVLKDLSFSIKEGEQVTLIGRTGAGKSTVFKLLLGLYSPISGSITIGGTDVLSIRDEERRGCIGCVEQRFSRVAGTVLDQITLNDPKISRDMAEGAARLAGLDSVIRSFPKGYDTPCADGMFSQGEWQLLNIARAAAANPKVLLLDEITANLDAETEARVLEALRRASKGRTVLSISHRIYESLGGRTITIQAEP